MVLVCHTVLQGHVTKRLTNSKGRKHARQVTILPSLVAIVTLVWELWKPLMVSYRSAKFGGHRQYSSRDVASSSRARFRMLYLKSDIAALSVWSIWLESTWHIMEWSVCMLNLPPKTSYLPNLVAINLTKVDMYTFKLLTWPHINHVNKRSRGFNEEIFSWEVSTLPSLVSIGCVQVQNALNLSSDLTRSPHWEVMRICGWESLPVCHHPGKVGDHRHSRSGDMFLICHIIIRDHKCKGLCSLKVASPS